jgi:hypothetical protein
MSASPLKADIIGREHDVRFGPRADMQAISARAVVRREAAGEALTMTAQPMAAPWVAWV